MSEEKIYPVPAPLAQRAWIDSARYESMYRESIEDSETFWRKQAERLKWIRPFTRVKDVSYDASDLHVRWFADGELNASVNCLDRHLAKRAEQTAILWEPDDPAEETRMVSYRDLHEAVCRFANASRSTCR
jgi:acetyl-CoA synthetase